MKWSLWRVAVLSVAMTNTGCAYFTTYTRPLDLRNDSYSLDVKQRVVVATTKTGKGNGSKEGDGARETRVICAEPSPDAMTVIGVSGGLSLGGQKPGSVTNAGVALSETGAFVGLRTHSIQLLRDAMYRLCEGYAADAISEVTFQSMQRRYQSTMMGLIAIEQLTGPVYAAQALLTSAASAQAGAPPGDTAVKSAQDRADSTNTQLLDERKKHDESVAKHSAALRVEQRARDDLKKLREQPKPDAEAIGQAEQDLQHAIDDSEAASREKIAAGRSVAAAETRDKLAQADVAAARSRVSASTIGGGTLGEVARSFSDSSRHLTDGVVTIVREVNRSYLRDSCFGFSHDLLRDPDLVKKINDVTSSNKDTYRPDLAARAMIATCQDILEYESERLAKEAGRSDSEAKQASMNNRKKLIGNKSQNDETSSNDEKERAQLRRY